MLTRAPAGPLGYSDAAAVDSWAEPGIGYVGQLGLMNGMPDGGFAPLGTTTRAQAAVTLVRLLKLIGESPIVSAAPQTGQ